jgi:hypothetical protein
MYADSDPELREMVKALRAEEQQWSEAQSPAFLKRAHAGASYALRCRSFDGQARRGAR